MIWIGVLLGISPPFLFGWFGLNWWLVPVFALLCNVLANFTNMWNQLRTAARKGDLPRAILYLVLAPAAMMTIMMSALFALGRWLS